MILKFFFFTSYLKFSIFSGRPFLQVKLSDLCCVNVSFHSSRCAKNREPCPLKIRTVNGQMKEVSDTQAHVLDGDHLCPLEK